MNRTDSLSGIEGGITMNGLIDRLMNAAKKFTVIDYGFFKITLFSAGVLAGTYFAPFFLSYTTLLWIVFIVSFVWIGYRTFFKYMR
jgi:hypothetical protein